MLVRLPIIGVVAAFAFVLLMAVLRHELKKWEDRDTNPCPTCHALAFVDRGALVDEQGHRLRFATPELAAKYAADYAKP